MVCLIAPLRSALETHRDSELETVVSTIPRYCHSFCLSSLPVSHASWPHGPRGEMTQSRKRNIGNDSS